jgi:hypothetical protein
MCQIGCMVTACDLERRGRELLGKARGWSLAGKGRAKQAQGTLPMGMSDMLNDNVVRNNVDAAMPSVCRVVSCHKT